MKKTFPLEIKFRPISPEDNVGLISAWIDKEQVGSLSFGLPMRRAELRFDIVLGQMFVFPEWRRLGIANAMLDKFFENYPIDKFRPYVDFTPDGKKHWDAYFSQERRAKWQTVK